MQCRIQEYAPEGANVWFRNCVWLDCGRGLGRGSPQQVMRYGGVTPDIDMTYFLVKFISLVIAFKVFLHFKNKYSNILTCIKAIKNCFFTNTLNARLNWCTTFSKQYSVKQVCYMMIYCSVFMIAIYDYVQKYYKMTWFGTRIYDKFAISSY